MAFDGNGNYNPPAPEYPLMPQTVISSADMNTIIRDIAAALGNCMTRDSQGAPSLDLNLFTKKIVNLGAATNPNDAMRKVDVDTATGDRDMAGHRLKNLPAVPVAGTDAVNADFVNTAQANRSMAGFSLTNLPAVPSVGSEAVSRDYVLGLSNNLPTQTGNTGKVLQTNGAAASWQLPPALTLYTYQNSGGL